MPAVVIGPTVAIIGLSLAGAAVKDVFSYGPQDGNGAFIMTGNLWVSFICAMVTFVVVVLCSTYGKKMTKLIPFIIGILAGYILAAIFTLIGSLTGNDALLISNFAPITALFSDGVKASSFVALPEFTFIKALGGFSELNGSYIASVAVAYIPVAFVVFAEHIADHKNLSSIIEQDLLEDPGLHRTLLGDGLATAVAGLFGGPAKTTYGENTGVLALSRVYDPNVVRLAATYAIVLSFSPLFDALVNSVPAAIVGGVSFILYGMISAVGIRNIVENKVDLTNSRNLIIAAVILVCGLGFSGGITFNVGGTAITLTAMAIAAIAGVALNAILPGNDYVFGANPEGDKSADMGSY